MRAAFLLFVLLLAASGVSAANAKDSREYVGGGGVVSTPPSGSCGLHASLPVGSVCFVILENMLAHRFEIVDAIAAPVSGVVQHYTVVVEPIGTPTVFCGESPTIPAPAGARMLIVEIATVDVDACIAGVATTGQVLRESLR